jgi:hypothetical protein
MFSFFVRLLKVYLWLHLFTKRRLNPLTDDSVSHRVGSSDQEVKLGVLVNVKGNVAVKTIMKTNFVSLN